MLRHLKNIHVYRVRFSWWSHYFLLISHQIRRESGDRRLKLNFLFHSFDKQRVQKEYKEKNINILDSVFNTVFALFFH